MTNPSETALPGQDPIYDAIVILTEDADALRECHTRAAGDWTGEPEAKARFDYMQTVISDLAKLRAMRAAGPLATVMSCGTSDHSGSVFLDAICEPGQLARPGDKLYLVAAPLSEARPAGPDALRGPNTSTGAGVDIGGNTSTGHGEPCAAAVLDLVENVPCSCPSAGGSLRWPCAKHPPK
ncbi:hypothetical protein [Achromobacter sp. DH1f]|uniref:hypothetical protein n=1 Tax=Achromobacter sp. DH1f TaxID=1397275 RepID=UPI00046A2178|nr:hypothetical protein [Achromobacter sp. DH1f]